MKYFLMLLLMLSFNVYSGGEEGSGGVTDPPPDGKSANFIVCEPVKSGDGGTGKAGSDGSGYKCSLIDAKTLKSIDTWIAI